jgi:hypothetical protein
VHFWQADIVESAGNQRFSQGFSSVWLTVHQTNLAHISSQWFYRCKKVFVVSMPRKASDLNNIDPLVPSAAIETDRVALFKDLFAQRAGRLITHQQKRGAWVIDVKT